MTRVSVIIPAYNAASFVGEAIESVLTQTVRPAEIIVVNDGSTDETEQALRPYRAALTYIAQPNRGVPAARNSGIQVATGDVLAFLDADDTWSADKLARQVEFLRRHPDVALHFTDFEVFNGRTTVHASGLRTKAIFPLIREAQEGVVHDAFYHLLAQGYIFPSFVVVRRSTLAAVGLRSEEHTS